MPRKPREELAGGIHHVWARGNNRRRIYLDRHDFQRYEAALAATIRRVRWHCLAYCLMPNHVHLLIETPEPNLGRGMRGLQSDYARTFNDRYGRTGHVFDSRFGSVLVRDDPQLAVLAPYIAHNPVKAGLVRRAEDWPWSSHARAMADAAPSWLDHERLIEYFGAWGPDPAARYSDAVAARAPGRPPS